MSWKPRVGETPREVARVDMTAGLFSGVHGKQAGLGRRVLEGESPRGMKVFLVLGVPGASMLAMMLVKIDMLTMPELEGKCEDVSQKTKSRRSGNCALEARHLRLRMR